MKKRKKQWEPIMFRPELPSGWGCFEQRGIMRYSVTTFNRLGKDHHNATEDRNFFVAFNEFDPEHHENAGIRYRYTVRGGNDIKPSMQLRYFTNLKDAENYMIYLMESTDRWIEEIHSKKHITTYEKNIDDIKKSHSRVRTSNYEL